MMVPRAKPLMVLCFGLLFLILPATAVEAQDARITGTVHDAAGRPVGGANLVIVGTQIGTLTDDDGGYTLRVEPGTHQVETNLIGFAPTTRTVTVSAGETVTLDFVISRREIQMEQIVATVAAGGARRVEIGTDIETIEAASEVERGAIRNLSDLLHSRASGVSITETSGEVGTASRVRIRGGTSLTQENVPLIMVDGIRVSNEMASGPRGLEFPQGQTISRLDDLNPQDIESMQVLKGPTAAALYGAEAAAGVIIIETKQGETSRIQGTIEQGLLQDPGGYRDNYLNLTSQGGYTDPNDPAIQQWRPIQNPVTGDIYARHNPLENPNTTPFNNGRQSRYDLSIAGQEGDAVDYYASASWDDLQGTMEPQSVDRYSGRLNFNVDLSEKWQVAVNTKFISSNVGIAINDRDTFGHITNGAAGFPFFSYGTRPDGSLGDCMATLIVGASEEACALVEGNFFANFDNLHTVQQEQAMDRYLGGVTINYRPFDWLRNEVTVGGDFIEHTDVTLIPVDPNRPFGARSDGFRQEIGSSHTQLTAHYAGTARFDLSENLGSATTVGGQIFTKRGESRGCTGQNFASTTATACDAGLIFTGFSNVVELNEVGAYFQEELSYKDYLFGTAAVRVDNSSAFGEAQGAIYSPSANLSALVSSMEFWDVDWISNLRLRAAWGTAAQAPDPFAANRTLKPLRLEDDGEQVSGVAPLDPGNPDLTAERSEEYELGFDIGLFDDRVTSKFTYFDAETRDVILETRVPPSTGFTGPRFVNLGTVTNNGFEAEISGLVVSTDDVMLDVSFQYSRQGSIVRDLGRTPPILRCRDVVADASSGLIAEGYAPGTYCSRVITRAERGPDGNIDPTSVEFAPGNIDIVGLEGYRAQGRQDPSNEQNLSVNATLFERFNVYALLNRKAGFTKYNSEADFLGPLLEGFKVNKEWALRHVVLSPEEQAMMERTEDVSSSLWMQDGTFVRWRELTGSYRFSEDLLQDTPIPFENARLTFGVKNLFVWTDYVGIDPEATIQGGADVFDNAEFFQQAPARTFFARLDFVF